MTSATAKNFSGGGVSYPALNQGGAGNLTILGSNQFANITNTYQPANVIFTVNTTQTFSGFGLSGNAGNLVSLLSTVSGTTFTVSANSNVSILRSYLSIKDSTATGGAAWYAGNTSSNVSNNSGWLFANPSTTGTANFLLLFI